ncbi:MAG: hypothetical protein ACK5PP_16115, partial [Acidimicrobiales bacterium]
NCPDNIRTNKSYFCSPVKNRFGLRDGFVVIALVLLKEGQQLSQMQSERTRILSREVSGNTAYDVCRRGSGPG